MEPETQATPNLNNKESPSLREVAGLVVRGSLLVAAVVFLVMALKGTGHPLEAGQPAPALNLVSYDGKAWDLGRFEGQPVVVNFWGTWCPPCLQELPHFVRAAHRWQDEVVFVGAAVNSPAEDAFRIIERFAVPYPIAQVDAASSSRWNARSLPTTVLLDAEHRVVWSVSGAITGADLDKALTGLGKSPAER
jgi:thiol-disulfide isomerase/thioredoxin